MIASLFVFACIDPQPIDGDTSLWNDSGEGSSDGPATIFDVRDGTIGDGDSVTLTGVLVSSPPTREDSDSGRSDGFFIQDPAGGKYSGLYVWSAQGFGDELTVEVGDELSISGQISEYYDWTELVVGDVGSLEVTGSGTLPDPVDLGEGGDVDWNAYESVPVSLSSQEILSVNSYSTGYLSGGVWLDDGFVYNDYDCRGSYEKVTGIVFYQYEAWSVNNRSEAELEGYEAPSQLDTTITEIRRDSVCGKVRVENVVATAPSWGEDDGKTWVFAQDPGGGEYSGIVVFYPEAFVDVQAGDLLTVVGDVSDYYGLVEIYVGDEGDFGTTSGGGEPVATEITEIPSDWTPWQSALVTLSELTAVTDLEYGAVLTDQGVYVDNLFYNFDAEEGTFFSSVTGPLYYTSYDDIPTWLVEPRDANDVSYGD
ncbi:MAG: hypothetical protein FJ102_15975 [Deltaproteobacteria bacterium]|nr:hypothetical protein [Deltaproteobacteria bacterium]